MRPSGARLLLGLVVGIAVLAIVGIIAYNFGWSASHGNAGPMFGPFGGRHFGMGDGYGFGFQPFGLLMAVIFGFEDNGRIVLMHDYMSDEPVLRLPLEQVGPFVCFLGQRRSALAPHDAMLEGVRIGVDNWHRGYTPGQTGRYWHGHAGLLKWREDLQEADELCFDEKRQLFFVNWWVFDCLADARTTAEKFLRRNAYLLAGSPHRHALEAAAVFADEARLLRSTMADKQMFLGPWTGKGLEHWTNTLRAREIAFLGQLLTLESHAIGELENLLDASDIPIRHAETTGTGWSR